MKPEKTPLLLEEILENLHRYPGVTITIKGGQRKQTNFEAWASLWLHTWKQGLVKDNTYEGTYREPIENQLIPYFGQMYLDDIQPIQIQTYFNEKANLYALETLKKHKFALRAIFQSAVENGQCDVNPVSSTLKVWSSIKPIEKNAWTQLEYDTAFEFAKSHEFGVPMMILMETGISRSELLGLTWDDFDKRQMCLRVRNGLIEARSAKSGKWQLQHNGLKNTHRERTVPISPFLTQAIDKLPRRICIGGKGNLHWVSTQYIVHSPRGKAFAPHNWNSRQFQVFMKELHSEYPTVSILKPHELRHTKATLLVQNGVDLYTVARLLGHRDLTMLSKRYLHDDLEAMRDALGI